MHVRKTVSRSSICFQVGEKRAGKFKIIRHIGCASTPEKIEALRLKALQALREEQSLNQPELFTASQSNLPTAKVSNWKIIWE